MDQERDTTDNAKSSRRGRYWLENGLPKPPEGDPVRPIMTPENIAPKGFQEISAAAAARIDPPMEPLPTLFELPDRTPEALLRKRHSSQFSIHDAHAGPPASHVDPPSGNHSHLSHAGPMSPSSSDSAKPDRAPEPQESRPVQNDRQSRDEAFSDDQDKRVAAYRDEPMTWAEDMKASWGTRSAIVMLVLMMVTLAFFSGRGISQRGSSSDEDRLSEAAEADLGETVVVLTEDVDVIDDLIATGSATSKHAGANPGQFDQSFDQSGQPFPSPNVDLDSAAIDNPPSYVTQAPASQGILGDPTTTLSSDDDLVKEILDAASTTEPELPPAFGSVDSVVAFRNPERESETMESNVATENLPTGMGDRLRLDDGYRYSETPHPIGNFLELLKVWELSHPQ